MPRSLCRQGAGGFSRNMCHVLVVAAVSCHGAPALRAGVLSGPNDNMQVRKSCNGARPINADSAGEANVCWACSAHEAITQLVNPSMANLHHPGQSSTAPLSKVQPCEKHFSESASVHSTSHGVCSLCLILSSAKSSTSCAISTCPSGFSHLLAYVSGNKSCMYASLLFLMASLLFMENSNSSNRATDAMNGVWGGLVPHTSLFATPDAPRHLCDRKSFLIDLIGSLSQA